MTELAIPDLAGLSATLEQVTGQRLQLAEDTHIARSLGLDSLAFTNLMMAVEDVYDVSIPMDDMAEIETVGDFLQVIRDRQGAH